MNKQDILSNCLLASIAHAVMTNAYPELDYELSWNGDSCSFILDNERCTVSFADDFCVGVVKNYDMPLYFGDDVEKVVMKDFPEKAIKLAKSEALLYLLEDNGGKAEFCASGAFWSDGYDVYLSKDCKGETVSRVLGDMRDLFDYLVSYYDMDSRAQELVSELFSLKGGNIPTTICLNASQTAKLPGESISDECRQSLAELRIRIIGSAKEVNHMHITSANKEQFDIYHYHDAWFQGFNYDYANRRITFSMEDEWEYDHFDLVFNNVIYFEAQSLSLWGGGVNLYHAHVRDELPELDKLYALRDKNDFGHSELDANIDFIGIELIVNSGDTLLIICESVDVDAVGSREQNINNSGNIQ